MLPPLAWLGNIWGPPSTGLLGLAAILGGDRSVSHGALGYYRARGSSQDCIRITWGPFREMGVPPRTMAPGPSMCVQ